MSRALPVAEFLDLELPILDVRSPGEYHKGHIPNAVNVPLLSDHERHVVGTLYKKVNRDAAILEALNMVGPKMAQLIQTSMSFTTDKKIGVYCWRGGKRSSSFAWLLELYGFQVFRIEGGYKAFRQWALHKHTESYKTIVLGGLTGSGKTILLHALRELGEQIIDLEKIAHHKGSAFGSLMQEPQPCNAQFENILAMKLRDIQTKKRVWIEDESRMIGKCCIPLAFWQRLRNSHVAFVERPLQHRIQLLTREYGTASQSELINCTRKLHKRLGGDRMQKIITAIQSNNLPEAIEGILHYYDKTYLHGLQNRNQDKVHRISLDQLDQQHSAKKLRQWITQTPGVLT